MDCLRISEELNEKKLVIDFFKLSSKISIKIIIENKKYKPPIHCEEDLHRIRVGSKYFIFLKVEKPVPVKPDIDSIKAFSKVT